MQQKIVQAVQKHTNTKRSTATIQQKSILHKRRRTINIFVTDLDPRKAAQNLCDKHVCKMLVETTQILSTVSYKKNCEFVPYKPTHVNHPCTLWAERSIKNFLWLLEHGVWISVEYTERYGKIHKCQPILKNFVDLNRKEFTQDSSELTPFVQAMPEKYKCDDVVKAYRAYYIGEKAKFAKWNHSKTPDWWPSSARA